MSLLAIDIGSSTCKALAFGTSGKVLARHSASYAPEFPRPSFAEIDPEMFWKAVCSCCRKISAQLAEPVQAVCLSSHGETFVAVDSAGRPVTRAILNQDSRAVRESSSCEAAIGRERLFQITGLFAHPMYPIPKILWLGFLAVPLNQSCFLFGFHAWVITQRFDEFVELQRGLEFENADQRFLLHLLVDDRGEHLAGCGQFG